MLNILIASMTNSFSKATQDEGLRFLQAKAEVIDELEATLPAWLQPRGWFPPFIHVLKFHPDRCAGVLGRVCVGVCVCVRVFGP